MADRWLTPPQIAKQLAVATGKVLGWIASGELAAVNVASTASSRPRWRVSPEALTEFLAGRQAKPPASPVPRARRRRHPEITSFV